MKATQQTETNEVTNKSSDSFGRVWGELNGKRVRLTFAIDPSGTWLDDEGNYHFEAR